MLFTIHRRGILKKDLEALKNEDINIGTKVTLKKIKASVDVPMSFVSDILIGAYIDDKLVGFISEVPCMLVEDSTVLYPELFDCLQETFVGTIDKLKVYFEDRINKKYVFRIFVEDKYKQY